MRLDDVNTFQEFHGCAGGAQPVRRLIPFARFGGEPSARGCSAAPPHASGSYGRPTFALPVRGLALTDVLAPVGAGAGEAPEVFQGYCWVPAIPGPQPAPPGTAGLRPAAPG